MYNLARPGHRRGTAFTFETPGGRARGEGVGAREARARTNSCNQVRKEKEHKRVLCRIGVRLAFNAVALEWCRVSLREERKLVRSVDPKYMARNLMYRWMSEYPKARDIRTWPACPVLHMRGQGFASSETMRVLFVGRVLPTGQIHSSTSGLELIATCACGYGSRVHC